MLFIALILYISQDISLEALIFNTKDALLLYPFLGVVFFIFAYTFRPLFFIVATPFDLFSGMIFGPVYGFFVSLTGCFFSSIFSYGV